MCTVAPNPLSPPPSPSLAAAMRSAGHTKMEGGHGGQCAWERPSRPLPPSLHIPPPPYLSGRSDEVRGTAREVSQLKRERVAALISKDILSGGGGGEAEEEWEGGQLKWEGVCSHSHLPGCSAGGGGRVFKGG